MGIRFACNQCGHVLNVKSDLAGKRGICPKCQARFDIPLESTVARRSRRGSTTPTPDGSGGAIASATPTVALSNGGQEPAVPSWSPASTPAANPIAAALDIAIPAAAIPALAAAIPDPIAEAPQLLWYVAPSGSTNQYGPASAEMFRAWIQEGRVAADSMVWRQDWSSWLRAGDVLPQLARSTPVVSVVPTAPLPAVPSPVAINPAAFNPVGINPAAISPRGGAPIGPIIVGPQGGAAPVAGAAPMIAPASGWSAPAIRDQPGRPAVVAVRGKLRPTINATTITIVLGLLLVVLVPVMWIVLRR